MKDKQILRTLKCPACEGRGKVKTIKDLIRIGPFRLIKEEFKTDCVFCRLEDFHPDFEENVLH